MDTDSFIVYIKAEDIYVDIAKDAKTTFDTLNYELERQLPKWKNKKVIRLMKDEIGGKLMTEFAALRPKTYSYLGWWWWKQKGKRHKNVCHKKKT